jgi:hypothetical protein
MRLLCSIAMLAGALAMTAVAVPGGNGTARGLVQYGPAQAAGTIPRADIPANTNFLTVGDFNSDGKQDVFVSRAIWTSGHLFTPVVLAGDGAGHFQDLTSSVFAGPVPLTMDPRRVLVADFNRDGRDDVFLADTGTDIAPWEGHQNTLVLSVPGGRLVDATANLPQVSDYTHAAAVGDVNRDGAPDIFVGQIGATAPNAVEVNDGTGRFRIDPDALPAHLRDPVACRVILSADFADVNRDGWPDLIMGGGFNSCYPMPSAILLNDGHGRFPAVTQEFPRPPAPFDSPADLQAGDLNGDGADDIVISYTGHDWVGHYLQILINDRHGRFRDQTALRLPTRADPRASWISWIQLLDLNGDRHLDIATAVMPLGPPWDEPPPFYLNDGTGRFAALQPGLGGDAGNIYAFGAFTPSGRRDIVFTKDSVNLGLLPEAATSNRLYGSIGPAARIALDSDAGSLKGRVAPGRREIVVWDHSTKDGFRLSGPGVARSTTRAATGIRYWQVQLKPLARYTYRSLRNGALRGSFRTGRR